MTQIFHNSNCSKSRTCLDALKARGESPHIIDYLTAALTEKDLKDLLRRLALPARAILREQEPAFKTHYPALDLDNEGEVLAAILAHPILLQRPIVVRGEKAVIGRPPENIEKLYD